MNELTECGSYLDGEKIFASESEEKAGTVQRWYLFWRLVWTAPAEWEMC